MGGSSSKPDANSTVSSPPSACPVAARKSDAAGDVCPVKYKNPSVFNVYGEKLDPSNMMPSQAQQLPSPGQENPLNTGRAVSGIARGGVDSTWVYPSEQMFYNSLKRKGKGGDVTTDDVSMMVAIHNNMNERTWRDLLVWERLHCNQCNDPRLLRFMGRPDDLSPKARLKTWMGYDAPFDRHDWVVDRCGKEVRYIIDYYHDEKLPVDTVKPVQHDFNAKTQILLDVRRALDSPEALVDRIRWGIIKGLGGEPKAKEGWPSVGQEELLNSRPAESIAPKEWTKMQKQFIGQLEDIQTRCQSKLKDLQDCQGEDDCERKTMAKDVCIGEVTCPKEVGAFMKAVEKGSEIDMHGAYGKLLACNAKFKEAGEKLFLKK